ncbi:MAG: hypothetical protein DHS20C09_04250 [marine bacterium B5-7]|nr:MAG: hypothetical protein DHS20C09_04250 [marine bacterium B5-7]
MHENFRRKKAAVIVDLKDQNLALILDDLIGYSHECVPFGLIGDLSKYANGLGFPILSLDIP